MSRVAQEMSARPPMVAILPNIAPVQSRRRRASLAWKDFDKERAMHDDRMPALGREHLEDLLDEALDESFPASDPVAIDFRTQQSPPRAANDDEPGSADNGR